MCLTHRENFFNIFCLFITHICLHCAILKYFYSNYKDYYYLPAEDIALHKSVSSFVDPEHRIPATASTCYSRKYSQFLPQWSIVVEPFFKRDYKSKELFFELTDEIKKNRKTFTNYANHVLAVLAASF